MNTNDLQIIKTAFDNYRVSKKIEFNKIYCLIFEILKKNKNIEPIITLTEDFISTDVVKFTALETLESFVTLWKETIFYCEFLCAMTPYYQDILTPTNSKYQKTTVYTRKLLHDKYNDFKNTFCTLLINTLISHYQNNPIDRSLVKKCLDIVRETKSLDYFNQQYTATCAGWLSKPYDLSMAVTTYLHVADCAEQYDIADTTVPILKDAVVIPTISTFTPTVDKMLDFFDPNLTYYYKLCKFLSQENTLGKIICQHIQTNVKLASVERAIEQNNKYMQILDGLEPGRFEKKGICSFFMAGFQVVFEGFSETLAMFIDSCFQKKLSEDEFEVLINDCIALANYIKDRDVFFAYYKKMFSRRLLTSKKIALERIVLTSLKKQFSAGNTHHLERMFKDIEAAEDINQEFKQENGASPMSVTVLSQGCWPNFSLGTVPACMQPHFEEFKKFYKTKYGNRNLKILSIGTCEIKMGKYILHTNVAQMNVLLALNETGELDKICEITQLSSDVVEGVLASLILPKHPVVRKTLVSSASESRTGEVYLMNPAFKSKTIMVKISPPVKKETVVEQKATMKQIENERCLKIDASVVRLLKARKQTDYNTIVIETTKALQSFFTPNPQMIKRRIESLIEREFMKRDDEDSKMFVYLA